MLETDIDINGGVFRHLTIFIRVSSGLILGHDVTGLRMLCSGFKWMMGLGMGMAHHQFAPPASSAIFRPKPAGHTPRSTPFRTTPWPNTNNFHLSHHSDSRRSFALPGAIAGDAASLVEQFQRAIFVDCQLSDW